MKYLGISDLLFAPITLFLILGLARNIRSRNAGNPLYRWYLPALSIKLVMGILFGAVYTLYYGGGDTTNYHQSGLALAKLIQIDVGTFAKMLFGPTVAENIQYFNEFTGYPYYIGDHNSYMVCRLIVPFELITFGSFLSVTMITSVIAFSGAWRVFRVLCSSYPTLSKRIGWAILFIPSVSFWGSGIMKDTFTITATCWLFAELFMWRQTRRIKVRSWIVIVISSLILLNIKPYIFVAFLPCALAWIAYDYSKNFKNPVIRTFATPIIAAVTLLIGTLIWFNVRSELGNYSSLNTILEKAEVTQKDLKRSAYQGESVDIGDFDATIDGALDLAPSAIVVGLFRPFIWESRNPLMLFSGLENLFILILSINGFIFNLGRTLRGLSKDPAMLFCLLFAIIMAFSVGLSTSNFGSLVRYKIPLLPFYVLFLLIVTSKNWRQQNVKKQIATRTSR